MSRLLCAASDSIFTMIVTPENLYGRSARARKAVRQAQGCGNSVDRCWKLLFKSGDIRDIRDIRTYKLENVINLKPTFNQQL